MHYCFSTGESAIFTMAGVAASGNIFFQTGSLDIREAEQFMIADNVTNKQQWAMVVDIDYV